MLFQRYILLFFTKFFKLCELSLRHAVFQLLRHFPHETDLLEWVQARRHLDFLACYHLSLCEREFFHRLVSGAERADFRDLHLLHDILAEAGLVIGHVVLCDALDRRVRTIFLDGHLLAVLNPLAQHLPVVPQPLVQQDDLAVVVCVPDTPPAGLIDRTIRLDLVPPLPVELSAEVRVLERHFLVYVRALDRRVRDRDADDDSTLIV